MPTAEDAAAAAERLRSRSHGYPRRSIDGLQHVKDFLKPDPGILPCTDGLGAIEPCFVNGWQGF
jgi:hypothetical protein